MELMAIERKAVRLLILEDSQNEAERIVSLFRNSGLPTRVQRADTPEALSEALANSWDLCIASYECTQLPLSTALKILQKSERDLSFIQIIEEQDSDLIIEALQMGAQDAVRTGADDARVRPANRELANSPQHPTRRTAQLALHETEKRYQ